MQSKIKIIKQGFPDFASLPSSQFNFINDIVWDIARNGSLILVKEDSGRMHYIKIYDPFKDHNTESESKGVADIISGWILTNIGSRKNFANRIAFVDDLLLSDSPQLQGRQGMPLDYLTHPFSPTQIQINGESEKKYKYEIDHQIREYFLSRVIEILGYEPQNVQFYKQKSLKKVVQFDGMFGEFDEMDFKEFIGNLFKETPLGAISEYTLEEIEEYKKKHGIVKDSAILKLDVTIKGMQEIVSESEHKLSLLEASIRSLKRKQASKEVIQDKEREGNKLKKDMEEYKQNLLQIRKQFGAIALQKISYYKSSYLEKIKEFKNSGEFKKNYKLLQDISEVDNYINSIYKKYNPFTNLERTLDIIEKRIKIFCDKIEHDTSSLNRWHFHKRNIIPSYEAQLEAKKLYYTEGERIDVLSLNQGDKATTNRALPNYKENTNIKEDSNKEKSVQNSNDTELF